LRAARRAPATPAGRRIETAAGSSRRALEIAAAARACSGSSSGSIELQQIDLGIGGKAVTDRSFAASRSARQLVLA
jgi:hypothetical protein